MTNSENDTRELTRALENAANENHQLRDRIDALEEEIEELGNRQGGGRHKGGIDNNPLCVGCYRWRLLMAVITGTAAGLFTLRMLAAHYNAAQALAERITDAQDNAKTVAMVISAVTALAPVSTTFIEWKWKLYRAGHGGVFHGIAELWTAFKKVLGRK